MSDSGNAARAEHGGHALAPAWMTSVLRGAAVYNVVWGGVAILLPDLFFRLARMPAPNYPSLWRCIGMIVGVYGVGYWIAARDPLAHWPIVLVGLLGKLFGPIGFLFAAGSGELPWRFGWTILTNDLAWWMPFGLILWAALRRHLTTPDVGLPMPIDRAMSVARVQSGQSLADFGRGRSLLVVFLRHLGCTFCREALADLAAKRGRIEAGGVRLVLVHMGSESAAEPFFERFGLGDVARVSDPQRALYRAFELQRGGLAALFGPRVWLRAIGALWRGAGLGALAGDGLQMPGAFLLFDGRIVVAYRHRRASDRPDYAALAATSCDVSRSTDRPAVARSG